MKRCNIEISTKNERESLFLSIYRTFGTVFRKNIKKNVEIYRNF